MKQIAPCKCGEKNGWYERLVKYYKQYYLEDGTPESADDGENRRAPGGKRKYCAECGRDITHLIQETTRQTA